MGKLILFGDNYRNKRVLITGNTGFKGSWLSEWLLILGAEVSGFSDNIPTVPSLFAANHLEERIRQYWGDLQNREAVLEVITEVQPDFIFHLGAQALVKRSYQDPVETFATNTLGTVHVLDAFSKIKRSCVLIDITSDKCYENVEWTWGYRENDRLGGKDPYGASKGAAELAFHSFYHSFIRHDLTKRAVTARTGNVIGGGDWAPDRIVPDCIRSWSEGFTVSIRSPFATRPWQHVLEPLSGYLRVGELLTRQSQLNGESFNFGPDSEQNKTVLELIESIGKGWEEHLSGKALYEIEANPAFYEAGLLKLNIDKALHFLQWRPTLRFTETAAFTNEWYQHFYKGKAENMTGFTVEQINKYIELATKRNQEWISISRP